MHSIAHTVVVVLAATLLSSDARSQSPEQELMGRVVDADHDTTLVSLAIELFNAQGERQAITWDTDGHFNARIDRTQFYQLVVRADGFAAHRELVPSCSYHCLTYTWTIAMTNEPPTICGNK